MSLLKHLGKIALLSLLVPTVAGAFSFTSVTPNVIPRAMSGVNFALHVVGTGFDGGESADIDGVAYTALPVNSTHLDVVMDAGALNTLGSHTLRITFSDLSSLTKTLTAIQGQTVAAGFYTCGVKAFVGNTDPDSNSVCQTFVRQLGNSGAFDSSTTGFRRPGQPAHDAAIFNLNPGMSYEVKTQMTDGSADVNTTWSVIDTITTRKTTFNITGPLMYISQSGDDGEDCTDPGLPCQSLYRAELALYNQPNHGHGGGIAVGPGIYNYTMIGRTLTGSDQFSKRDTLGNRLAGTPDTMYYLIGKTPSLIDSTVFDRSVARQFTWTSMGVGDSVYKTPFTSGDSIYSVYRGWGDRYPRKCTLVELHTDKVVAGAGSGLANCDAAGTTGWAIDAKGWYWQNDTLYLKTPDGVIPGASEWFHMGYLAEIHTFSPYWHISNITVRYSRFDGIVLGAGNGSVRGSGAVIDSCRFYGNGGSGTGSGDIQMYNGGAAGDGYCDSVVVRNCRMDGGGLQNEAWAEGKARYTETSSVSGIGMRHLVEKNRAVGGFNGPALVNGCAAGDTICGLDDEVMNNFVSRQCDDAYELATFTGGMVNMRVVGDSAIACKDDARASGFGGDGFKLAPVPLGPVWMIRNLSTHNFSAMRTGGSNGRIAFYHNTFGANVRGWYCAGGGFRSVVSYNNIYVPWRGSAAVPVIDVDATDAANRNTLNFFNFDLVDSNNFAFPGNRWTWTGTQGYSYPNVQTVLGQEKNGVLPIGAGAAPAFVDSALAGANDFRLLSTSKAIDAGRRIPGINTQQFGQNFYFGGAPDIGAYEYSVPLTFGSHRWIWRLIHPHVKR